MGLFDKMFGRGASSADDKAQQRFDELKNRFSSALELADQQQIQFQNLHVQDDKLFVRGIAPTQQAANKVWDQVKAIDPSLDSITLELTVIQTAAQSAVAPSGQSQGGETYTVKSGDTLSKISKQFYGDANEYMRIFYANRDKLRDPNKIQVGQQLTIPPENS
jgi:nucleoid-associated protein YgaU